MTQDAKWLIRNPPRSPLKVSSPHGRHTHPGSPRTTHQQRGLAMGQGVRQDGEGPLPPARGIGTQLSAARREGQGRRGWQASSCIGADVSAAWGRPRLRYPPVASATWAGASTGSTLRPFPTTPPPPGSPPESLLLWTLLGSARGPPSLTSSLPPFYKQRSCLLGEPGSGPQPKAWLAQGSPHMLLVLAKGRRCQAWGPREGACFPGGAAWV